MVGRLPVRWAPRYRDFGMLRNDFDATARDDHAIGWMEAPSQVRS
jgi:hypothetical protein